MSGIHETSAEVMVSDLCASLWQRRINVQSITERKSRADQNNTARTASVISESVLEHPLLGSPRSDLLDMPDVRTREISYDSIGLRLPFAFMRQRTSTPRSLASAGLQQT